MRLWEIKPRKGFMILLPGNMKMYFKDLVKENSFEGKKNEDYYADFESIFNQKNAQQKKGTDVFLNLKLTFEESIKGIVRVMNFQKQSVCPECKGTKLRPGYVPTNCQSCQGQGYIKQRQGAMQFKLACSKCGGTGKIIKHQCLKCRGKGNIKLNEKMEIKIPQGVQDGQNLRFGGEGNINPDNNLKGDLVISISVEPHPEFHRIGHDIWTKATISLAQAAIGDKITINTIWGQQEISIPPGTQYDDMITLKNQGVKYKNEEQEIVGDHKIRIIIETKIQQNVQDQEEIHNLYKKLRDIEQEIDPYQTEKKQQEKNNNKNNSTNGNSENESIFSKLRNIFN